MASAKNNQLISYPKPHFCPRSTAKTNDKSTISRRMTSIGIRDVVTASVYSEKTRMKKLMMMKMIIIIIIIIIIGERAKRARHSQDCSIENRGYIYYIYSTCKFCSYYP